MAYPEISEADSKPAVWWWSRSYVGVNNNGYLCLKLLFASETPDAKTEVVHIEKVILPKSCAPVL